MNKILVYTFTALSCASLLLTGLLVINESKDQTQSLVVEFEYAGRFEVIYTHHGIPETKMCFGVHHVYISRNINEHWNVSFMVNKMETGASPLFVHIKTLDGNTIYRTVLANQESVLFMDCSTICDISNL
jgi:hypothetical protein